MFDVAATLSMLHHGDTAYPAGGFAFSWGVEGLLADGLLADAAGLDDLIDQHLRLRWASMDRILLRRALVAPGLDAVAAVDRLAEAATASAQMRDGSRRAGRALLGVSVRLGGPLTSAYRPMVSADARLGHLPIVQALVYRDGGLGLDAAQVVSGWTLVTGLVGAAVRLGLVGHIEAQRSLGQARRGLAAILAASPGPEAQPSSFTPLIDIAVSRGPARQVRLFST